MLGIDVRDHVQELVDMKQYYSVHLRDLLAGRSHDPELWNLLRDRTTRPEFVERLSAPKGSTALYKAMFQGPHMTGFGRIRGGLEHVHASTADYVDLADDIRKAVLFVLVDAGYDLVTCCRDEFVLLIDVHRTHDGPTQGDVLDRVHNLVEKVVASHLGEIPARCGVRLATTW